MEKALSVFCCVVGEDKREQKSSTCTVMESIPSLHAMPGWLRCDSLRLAAVEGGKNEADLDKLEGGRSRTAAREWFRVTRFEATLSTSYAAWDITSVHSLTRSSYSRVTGFILTCSSEKQS